MSDTDTFIDAVHRCAELPHAVREAAKRLGSVEAHCFDQSYIEFLDTQIRLSPRGPAWTERLKKRREGLFPFRDRTLLSSSLHVGRDDYTVEVDPTAASVVYWERYADIRDGT
jgi:hypothetical protein